MTVKIDRWLARLSQRRASQRPCGAYARNPHETRTKSARNLQEFRMQTG
jgi:hypothetical protein